MKFKFVIALICAFLLVGCKTVNNNDYFKVIAQAYNGTILYDTRTGVEYWVSNIRSNDLTVLVDRDGKPLIYDEVERED